MMHQPGMVTNPARGQLNRENALFPVPVRTREFGFARRVRLSRPASPCSFPALGLNLVLAHGIPPDFRDGVHLFILYRHPSWGQSRVYRTTQLRTDRVRCRESTSTGPVALKIVRVTSAAFSGFTIDHLFNAPLFFPTPTSIYYWYARHTTTRCVRTFL